MRCVQLSRRVVLAVFRARYEQLWLGPSGPEDPMLIPVPQGAQNRDALLRRTKIEFAKRYSALIAALNDFADSYAKHSGDLVPLDKIKAVTKAWRELQKLNRASSSWGENSRLSD